MKHPIVCRNKSTFTITCSSEIVLHTGIRQHARMQPCTAQSANASRKHHRLLQNNSTITAAAWNLVHLLLVHGAKHAGKMSQTRHDLSESCTLVCTAPLHYTRVAVCLIHCGLMCVTHTALKTYATTLWHEARRLTQTDSRPPVRRPSREHLWAARACCSGTSSTRLQSHAQSHPPPAGDA